MRAVVVDRFGGREEMHVADVPEPKLATDGVRIRIRASSANPVDSKTRDGKQQDAFPHTFPLILGYDAAGVVDAVGPAAHGVEVGDEVIAYCRKQFVGEGTYAEHVVVPDWYVAPKPRSADWAAAASLPLAGLTAHQALGELGLREGETILIHGGSGGVGSIAVQLAVQRGATVLTTASAGNLDYVRGLGAAEAIDYRAQDFVEVVRATRPGGVECVLDLVGSETLERSAEVLAPGGRVLSTVQPPETEAWCSRGFTPHYILVRPDGGQLAELSRLVDEGALHIELADVVPLEDAADALGRLEDHEVTRGKIAIKIA
jgi:NADPH:quinone reductase-like Zn-dependent oxidoreductase